MFDNASPTEIVWTLFSFAGTVLCAYLFWQAEQDKQALDDAEHPTPIRNRKVRANRRHEFIRVTMLTIFTLLGSYSMTVPDPILSEVALRALIVSWAIIACTFLLVLDSVLCVVERRQNMRERIAEQAQYTEDGNTDGYTYE